MPLGASNTVDTDFCIEALEDALQRFEAPEQSQRNDLHYRLTWYFADLVDADPRPSSFGLFGVPSEPSIVGRLSDRRGSDGVLLLNGLLVRSCIALLGRLASTSRQLEPVLYRLRDVLERFDTAVVGSWSADPDLWRTSS